MTEEMLKKTYLVRKGLDRENRHFVYTDDIEQTYTKVFNYVSADVKMLDFAREEIGMISDCYILYAVAHLGVAEVDTIMCFLKALCKKYPDLSIICDDKNVIRDRLRLLHRKGYLFKHRYNTVNTTKGEEQKETVSLYSLSEDANNLVKQRLQKRVSMNSLIQMKPIKELIGWSCAGLVGSMIASNSVGFENYLERVLRTKQLGTVYMPCELKIVDGEDSYYIAVVSSYLGINKQYQTDMDYAEWCAFKINTIKNYLNCRTTKGVSYVVVAVEDNADLNEITQMIHNSRFLEEYYERILFTGEGAVRDFLPVKDAFLSMRKESSSERGYELIQCDVPFI